MNTEATEYLDAMAVVDANRPKQIDDYCSRWASVLPLLNAEEQTDALAPCGEFES